MANAQVHYLSEQRERSFAEVRKKLVGQKIDTLIDFRLADKLGQWSLYDVVFDDASLVSNDHEQFTCIVRDHSYAGLVKNMKEQTLAVKACETTTAPNLWRSEPPVGPHSRGASLSRSWDDLWILPSPEPSHRQALPPSGPRSLSPPAARPPNPTEARTCFGSAQLGKTGSV
jgi:hypothetical protein